MSRSRETREVDLGIGEGAKESRPQLGSMCSPLPSGDPARVLPGTGYWMCFFCCCTCRSVLVMPFGTCDRWHPAKARVRRATVSRPEPYGSTSKSSHWVVSLVGSTQIEAHDQEGRVSPNQLQCPPSSRQRRRWRVDAPHVGWQESVLSYGDRHSRVLGWEQRSLPPRKAVNSEFIRPGSVN